MPRQKFYLKWFPLSWSSLLVRIRGQLGSIWPFFISFGSPCSFHRLIFFAWITVSDDRIKENPVSQLFFASWISTRSEWVGESNSILPSLCLIVLYIRRKKTCAFDWGKFRMYILSNQPRASNKNSLRKSVSNNALRQTRLKHHNSFTALLCVSDISPLFENSCFLWLQKITRCISNDHRTEKSIDGENKYQIRSRRCFRKNFIGCSSGI